MRSILHPCSSCKRDTKHRLIAMKPPTYWCASECSSPAVVVENPKRPEKPKRFRASPEKEKRVPACFGIRPATMRLLAEAAPRLGKSKSWLVDEAVTRALAEAR